MDAKVSEWRPGPNVCRCCFTEGCYKDISTEYFWMGKREVYAEMLSETFDLTIAYSKSGGPNSNSRLICENCIARLRDATDFKRQVKECEKTFIQHLDPGNNITTEIELRLEADHDKTVKLESVKLEKRHSDDDFDDRNDFATTLDDDDDDLDDQPLLKLASKTPKKETENVDILDLLDNAKVTEKRKSSTKSKEPPTKKLKKKEPLPKPSASKSLTTEKKKKGPERMTGLENLKRNGSGRTKRYKTKTKNNLLTVLEHTTACPFRWLHNTFMCFYCDTKFNDIISLKSHTMDNHPDTTETFNKFRWSYRHVKVEITDLRCKLCDSGFDDVKPAKEHLASDHEKRIDFAYSDALIPYKLLNSNSYTCHVCDKVYYRFAHLSNHLNDHYRNYVCDTCGAPFLERSRLRQHLLTHGGGSYPCVHCGEVFESVITKRHHMSRFHWKNGFRLACPHCPERFKAYRDRIHHMSVVHNVKNENCGCPFCILPAGPSKDDDSTKPYECNECHKRFTRKHELNSHRVSHTGERPYTCEVCLKSYGRKRTLREHMRIHNNDKRFACQECGRAFVQKCSLKSHLRVHFMHKKI